MGNKELLLAISDMMDQKLDAINVRMDTFDTKLDAMESRLDAKIDAMESRLDAKIDAVEGRLGAEIDLVNQRLSADVRNINITLENNVIPRLKHIEQCYLAASERYINETGRIQGLVADVQVIKSVVQEHSKQLQKIS